MTDLCKALLELMLNAQDLFQGSWDGRLDAQWIQEQLNGSFKDRYEAALAEVKKELGQ